MKEKKYYIALDDFERRVVVNCVNEMRNKLIADGKYTDALDEVLLKVIHSKSSICKEKSFRTIFLPSNVFPTFSNNTFDKPIPPSFS